MRRKTLFTALVVLVLVWIISVSSVAAFGTSFFNEANSKSIERQTVREGSRATSLLQALSNQTDQVTANSTGSKLSIPDHVQLSRSPKVRNEKFTSDLTFRGVQLRTESEEKFPKELKPLQQETLVNQQEQTNQPQFETKDPSAKTTTGLPDQSYVASKPFENMYAVSGGNYEPMGSTSVVFTETFEGAFPGDNWWVGDANSGSGSDYWDDTGYRAASGSWSGWCAQVGDNSVYGGTNAQQHKYDNYMDAYMAKKYTVDMSAWDIGYVDFYAWCDAESSYDYLIAGWWNSSAWQWDNNYRLTGTAASWTRYYWRIPDSYLISSGAFAFSFHSDSSIVKEGVYLDNINLIRADVTLDNYYISPTSVHPGESFTAYYYVNNPCPFSINVGLGLSILSPGGTIYNDPAHDIIVTISPGFSWVSRLFNVPSSAPTGLYSVAWGIWSGTPGSSRCWGGSGWVSGQLTVAGWPDLMWTDIWTDPSSPTGGQNARIYCQIKNQGTGSTTTSFTNYFYIDGSYDSYGVNNGLAAGSVFNWYMDRTLGPGYHTILARADVNNNVPESSEANNDYNEKIWWKGPDLIVVDIWWVDAYGNRDPTITSGQPFTVYFQIKNNGDADAVGTFTTYIFIDGWGSAAGSNNGLSAGATFTWYVENVFISSPGGHSIRAVVDYNNAIPEANKDTGSGVGTGETNNERTETVSVQASFWTIVTYLSSGKNGGDDLSTYVGEDINRMEEVGSSTQITIVALADKSGNGDTHAYFFKPNQLVEIALSDINPSWTNELDMGDTNTLITFCTYAINRFRAVRYGLILYNHGGNLGGVIWDDISYNYMKIDEIRFALQSITANTGVAKLSIFGLDACLMAMTEAAYEIRSYANIFVASEYLEYGDSGIGVSGGSWRYGEFLSDLRAYPLMTPETLSQKIVDTYVDHWQSWENWPDPTKSVTLSAINLNNIDNLANKVSSLGDLLKSQLYAYRDQVNKSRMETEQYYHPWITDLYHFTERVYMNIEDPSIRQACLDVQSALTSILVRERHHTGSSDVSVDHAHGLTIWFPNSTGDYILYKDYYRNTLQFGSKSWIEFLTWFNDYSPPTSLSININSGASFTNAQSVTLTLNAQDAESGVRDMCFSNDGITYSPWEPYSTSKSWILSSGDGTKYVYFKVRDNAGHVSQPVYDTIVLDTSAPVPSEPSPIDGIKYDNDTTAIKLQINWVDDLSGIATVKFRYKYGASAWSSWLSPTGSSSGTYWYNISCLEWRNHVEAILYWESYATNGAGSTMNTQTYKGPTIADDDDEGPVPSSGSTDPDGTIYDDYTGYIRFKIYWVDSSGVFKVKFEFWAGSEWIGAYDPTGSQVDAKGNGWYYFDMPKDAFVVPPRPGWIDYVGKQIKWHSVAWDADNDREDDSAWTDTGILDGPYIRDDDVTPPDLTNPTCTLEPTNEYKIQITATDPSGVYQVLFRYKFDAGLWSDWKNPSGSSGNQYWYVILPNEWKGHTMLYWEVYAEDNDNDRTNDHSSITSPTYQQTLPTPPDLYVQSIAWSYPEAILYANVTYYKINVTIANGGTVDAGPFNVTFTAYYLLPDGGNLTEFESKVTVPGLAAGDSITVQFDFMPQHKGAYIVVVFVDSDNTVAELNEANNINLTPVSVRLAGDVDGDGVVNYRDLFLLARAYGSSSGDSNWNCYADFNADGKVDYIDLFILARNYGKVC